MSRSVADPRLFDADPLTGLVQYFHFNPDDDSFAIETVQDVEGIIEVNKAVANDAPLRWGEFSHVASIPQVIMMRLAKDGIVSPGGAILDESRFRAWLNDRDNRAFRTRPGVV